MIKRLLITLIATTVAFASTPMEGAILPISLGENSTIQGWDNLTGTRFPGYGGFPGSSPWPNPIASNLGTGTGTLTKFSGSAYLGNQAVYFGGFSDVPNTLGGTLSVAEEHAITNLKTIVFQLEIGEAFGYDLYDAASPLLFINGSATSIAATFSEVVLRLDTGDTFLNPETQVNEPIYINTHAFQWNVDSLGPISSFEIQFSGVQHAQLHSLSLQQSEQVYGTSVIPEPSTWTLLISAAGTALLVARRRRR